MIKIATLLRSAIAVFALLAVVTNANKAIKGRNKSLRKLVSGTGKSSKGGQKKNKETRPDIVVFTPAFMSAFTPRATLSLTQPTPATEANPFAVGDRVLFQQVGISSDESLTNQVGTLEGVCTLIGLPAKLFCDWVFDFGNEEDIVTTTVVLEQQQDGNPETENVGVIRGGAGKYGGVTGALVSIDTSGAQWAPDDFTDFGTDFDAWHYPHGTGYGGYTPGYEYGYAPGNGFGGKGGMYPELHVLVVDSRYIPFGDNAVSKHSFYFS